MPEPIVSGIRFSVVIPAYNAARTIRDAIGSCLAQSFAPAEVIVVDDGSTDETEAIVRGFPLPVRYLGGGGNRGPAAARNTGMDAATGTHIAFLDADDIWHPEKLRLASEVLARQPQVAGLFHRFTHGPWNEQPLPATMPARRYPFLKLLWRNPIATPCVVLPRDPALRFDESMSHMEDYDLWLRCALQQPFYCLELPLTRLGRPVLAPGGQSSDRNAMRRGERRAYRNLARRRPVYKLLLPLLLGFSWCKHAVKQVLQ